MLHTVRTQTSVNVPGRTVPATAPQTGLRLLLPTITVMNGMGEYQTRIMISGPTFGPAVQDHIAPTRRRR